MRETVIQWAHREKIIAIVRGIEPEKCLKVAQALYDGGIRIPGRPRLHPSEKSRRPLPAGCW